MIQPTRTLPEYLVNPLTAGFFASIHKSSGNEILKHVHPICNGARRAARAPFVGSDLVAASVRIGKVGCHRAIVCPVRRVNTPCLKGVSNWWPFLQAACATK